MASAKKLPSGNWRVRLLTYTDENKKKHYKSFTAPTKKEAEMLALTYIAECEEEENLTVYDAVKGYIDSRSSVIAPSTLREYTRSLNYDFESIKNEHINDLTQESVQIFINELARDKKSKTVHNIHGLLSATLKMYRPTFKLNTRLPQKEVRDAYIPTDADIKIILENSKDDIDLHRAILLAAFGPLRRSEICGLKAEDFKGNVIHVKRAMVRGDNDWVIKLTKTNAGDRRITLPDFVVDEFKGLKGFVVHINPSMISDRFIDLVAQSDVEHFTFHSLRHYCASRLHSMNMPDAYIMERGGWESDSVLKQIYRHALSDKSSEINNSINDKLQKIFS